MKTKSELRKMKKKEWDRKLKIINFLKKNMGKYFTGQEVESELGISCAEYLLIELHGHRLEGTGFLGLKGAGIKRMEIRRASNNLFLMRAFRLCRSLR